jgi:Uma2 family endonuclease
MKANGAMKTLVTCEEFERIAPILGPCELIDGEVIQLSPGGPGHSYVCSEINTILNNFVKRKKLGRVLGNEAGIRIDEQLPRSRGADIAFISYKRLPPGKLPDEFLKVGPELVVEVFPAKGSWDEMQEKIDDYHKVRVEMVWVADPQTRTVKLYPRKGEPTIIHDGSVITGGKILPGFSCPVAKFFD